MTKSQCELLLLDWLRHSWRPVLGLVVGLAAWVAALGMSARSASWLSEIYVLNAEVASGSVLALAGFTGAAVYWVFAERRFASTLTIFRLRTTSSVTLFAFAVTAGAAFVATAWVGKWPNWPHWDVALVSGRGIEQMLAVLFRATNEELMYRYMILGTLVALSRSKVVGLLLTSAHFALNHGEPLFFYVAGGLWFGALAVSTCSIWPAVAAHTVTNIVLKVLFDSGPMAHPILLDLEVLRVFHVVFACTVLAATATMLWPLIRHDPLWRVVCWLRSRLPYPRIRLTSDVVEYPSTNANARASPPQLRTQRVSSSDSMS